MELLEICPRADDDSAADQIRDWFHGDAEGMLRMSFYAEPEKWFAFFGPTQRGWFITVDHQPVGFLDLEVRDRLGHFAYYISPDQRGKGYGTQILTLAVDLARQLGLTELEGGVEPDNAASIAALRKAGFELLPPDHENMLPAKRTI
jgi:RimJ/RimL family protein N-acetyltransferase